MSFKYLQGWCLQHFRGHPVKMFDKPCHEEIVLHGNIQRKPTLEQLDPISLLTTASFQAVIESEKVPSLLEQPLGSGTRFVMFFVVMDQKIAIKYL